MMIPGNYEANVAVNRGTNQVPKLEHFCRIEFGQIDYATARARMLALREMFPDTYELTLLRVDCVAHEVG